MTENSWKIDTFYLGEQDFPSETLWRSKNGQYQEAQGWFPCADEKEAQSKWNKHASNEKHDPFVIHYPKNNSYWLCWWEFSSESRYLRDRNLNKNRHLSGEPELLSEEDFEVLLFEIKEDRK